MTDNCAIVSAVPESLTVPAALPAGIQPPVTAGTGALTPASCCHQETPVQPLYKALASLPDAVVGHPRGRHAPEPARSRKSSARTSTTTPTGRRRTTLARPFTNGQANVNLVQPGTQWGDRLNQVDLRVTKVFNIGKGKLDLNVDFYNAFNSDAVLTELGSFGPVWRLPTSVIQPRFVKFSAQVRFLANARSSGGRGCRRGG